jgi:hypothetical protein
VDLARTRLTYRASAPLDPLLPYLSDSRLSVASLVGPIETSRLPLVFDALLELARRTSTPALADEVHELQGLDKARREQQARDAPPEVMPVLGVSAQTLTLTDS